MHTADLRGRPQGLEHDDPDKVLPMSQDFGPMATYHFSSHWPVTISSPKQSNLQRNLFPRGIRESALLYFLMSPERLVSARTGYRVSVAIAVGTTFAQVLGGIGIGLLAIKYLFREIRIYQSVYVRSLRWEQY